MRNPITNLLTTEDLSSIWIPATEALDHLGFYPDPRREHFIQILINRNVVPNDDFVYERQKHLHFFKWNSDRSGRYASHERQVHFDTLLVSLKCLAELKERYLDEVEQYYHEQDLYNNSIPLDMIGKV